MGFSGINYRVGPYFRAAKKDTPGIQVDLLFDRADNVLTLCEMKSSKSPIPLKVLDEIEHKRDILQQHYPRHTIQTVLVYDGTLSSELEKSPYIYKTINALKLI